MTSPTQPNCDGNKADLELLLRLRQGVPYVLDNLCELHYGLIKFWAQTLAQRFSAWAHFNPDDIAQDGMIGFVRAAEEHDARRYPIFHVYAWLHFLRAALAGGELQRVSRYQRENKRKVTEAHDELLVKLDRQPTVEEISVRAKLSVKQVQNILNTRSPFPRDLEDLQEEDVSATSASSPVVDPIHYHLVKTAVNQLKPSDADVIELYYRYGLTDQEVGFRLGMTKDVAKVKRRRALKKLKRIIGEGGS